MVTLIKHGKKITDAMITALSTAVSKGNYPETAAQLCGITRLTLENWLASAERDFIAGLNEDESIFIRLYLELKRAEAIAEDRMVQVVRESAEIKREWLPAITFLERRHRERWGRPAPIQIQQGETKVINITHVEVLLDEGGESRAVIEGESRELPGEKELLTGEEDESH